MSDVVCFGTDESNENSPIKRSGHQQNSEDCWSSNAEFTQTLYSRLPYQSSDTACYPEISAQGCNKLAFLMNVVFLGLCAKFWGRSGYALS